MENIQITARFKPISKEDCCPDSLLKIDLTNKQVITNNTSVFTFDEVYSSHHTNDEIFSSSISPHLKDFLSGKNLTIFTYGQTSSGKTFTMQGNDKEPGITHLLIKKLFSELTGNEFSVKLSQIEIYNEKPRDLHKDQDSDDLKLLKSSGKLQIQNLGKCSVKSAEEAIAFYTKGNQARSIADNGTNKASSRSHSIFRLELEINLKGLFFRPELNLVDLAGSEGLESSDKNTQNECKNINQSLLTLKRIVSNLKEGNCRPSFRDSALTRILENSLNGSSFAVIICCMVASKKQFSETKSTLNFAQEAKEIKIRPVSQVLTNKNFLISEELFFRQIREKDEEILKLKKELEDIQSGVKEKEENEGFYCQKVIKSCECERLRENFTELAERFEKLLMEKQALFNESKEKDEEIEELKKELNMSRCQSENLDFQNTFPFSLKKDQKIEQLKEEIVKINKIAEFLMTENKRLKNTNFFFQSFERMEVDFTPKSQSKVSSEVSSQSSHDVNFQHLQEKVAKLEEIIKEKEESAQSLKTEIFSMKKSCNELEIKNQCLQQDLNQKANLLRVYKSLIPRKTVTSRTIQDLPYTLAKEQDELDISELNHSIELSVSNYKKRNLKRNPKVFEEFKIQSFDLNDIEN
jgi:hypothetical protein